MKLNPILLLLILVGCRGAGIDQFTEENNLFEAENVAPIADAGVDQTSGENCQVNLYGDKSYDVDSTVLQFQWQQLTGVPVNIYNSSQATAFFKMPISEYTEEKMSFELSVIDGSQLISKDQVDIYYSKTQDLESGSIRFSEKLISGDFNYPFGVSAKDLDGDGDIDLTVPDIWSDEAFRTEAGTQVSALWWFENDGLGNFQKHMVYYGERGFLERHAIGDINGDSLPDVVIVNNRDGQILWFENNESNTAESWKRHIITTNLPRAYDVVLEDFDDDGDIDVAASGYLSNIVSLFENDGFPESEKEWQQFVIGEKMSEVRTIRPADFNNDGKIDLLATAAGASNIPIGELYENNHNSQIVWFANPGTMPKDKFSSITCPNCRDSWKKNIVDKKSRAPIHGQANDVDDDGNMDIVMAFGFRVNLLPEPFHELAWYEAYDNLGEISWEKHFIGKMPRAFEATSGDLDGDGDIDVVATSHDYGDKLVWFENNGNPCGDWKMHLLKENWTAANQVIITDINGDGRMDIVATADNGNGNYRRVGSEQNGQELRLWINEGY